MKDIQGIGIDREVVQNGVCNNTVEAVMSDFKEIRRNAVHDVGDGNGKDCDKNDVHIKDGIGNNIKVVNSVRI